MIGGRLGDIVVTSPVQPFSRSGRYIVFLGRDGPAGPTIFPQAVLEVKRGRRRRRRAAPGGLHLRVGLKRAGLDPAIPVTEGSP